MSHRTAIALIGGGGHCVSVIDAIEEAGAFEIDGVVDLPDRVGTTLSGYPIRWSDADLGGLCDTHRFCVTIGHVKSAERRRAVFTAVRSSGGAFVVVRSPHAVVSARAKLGDGTVVLHGAVVNAGATIGENCIVNSRALVEHDARVGAHVHISTGAAVNGDCVVEEGAMVGSMAVLRHGISVGAGAIVGAGAVVVRDVPPGATVVGNPARLLPGDKNAD